MATPSRATLSYGSRCSWNNSQLLPESGGLVPLPSLPAPCLSQLQVHLPPPSASNTLSASLRAFAPALEGSLNLLPDLWDPRLRFTLLPFSSLAWAGTPFCAASYGVERSAVSPALLEPRARSPCTFPQAPRLCLGDLSSVAMGTALVAPARK